jgi:hypothetical protein
VLGVKGDWDMAKGPPFDNPDSKRNWLNLAKAIYRHGLDGLAMCHNCLGIIPSEREHGVPDPCPHCGHFDFNEWETSLPEELYGEDKD